MESKSLKGEHVLDILMRKASVRNPYLSKACVKCPLVCFKFETILYETWSDINRLIKITR